MNIDKNYIERTHRLPFRFIDILNCLILILPTVLILLSTSMIRSYYLNNLSGFNGLLITSLILGLIGLCMLSFIMNRLIQNIKFRIIETGLDFKKNIEIAESVFSKLYSRQFIDKKNIDLGLVSAKSNLSGLSWGEINTIICFDNQIFINSRPTNQPVTIFENRLNLKRIVKEINKELKPSP